MRTEQPIAAEQFLPNARILVMEPFLRDNPLLPLGQIHMSPTCPTLSLIHHSLHVNRIPLPPPADYQDDRKYAIIPNAQFSDSKTRRQFASPTDNILDNPDCNH